ncbi:MAG: RebB family R body protein [Aestuariibacter sp.]
MSNNNGAGTVNDQAVDSVSQMSTLLIGNAAPQAMGLLDVAGAESMGMGMHNAVSSQHNSQISSAAAVTAACAKMLNVNPTAPQSPSAEKPTPPPFMPLGPTNTVSAEDMLKHANTLAESALKMMQEGTSQQQSDQSENEQEIKDLITKLQAFQKPAATSSPDDPKTDNEKKEDPDVKKQQHPGSQ